MVTAPDSQSIQERQQDSLLTLMIWFGVVLAIICVSLFHPVHYLLSGIRVNLRHWELWELGALVWTTLFLIYYFKTIPLDHQNTPVKKIMLCWFAILGFSFFALVSLALSSLGYSNPTSLWSIEVERGICYLHLFCVFGVVFFIMFIDKLLATCGEKEDKQAFRESYLLTGVPSVWAYVILIVYVFVDWLLHLGFLGTVAEDQEAFLSGAIAAQLIISNVVFVLLQRGALRHGL